MNNIRCRKALDIYIPENLDWYNTSNQLLVYYSNFVT